MAEAIIDGHPWDTLNEVTDSLAALIALAGDGSRLNDLSDAERRGYFSLAGRLATQQTELVAAMLGS